MKNTTNQLFVSDMGMINTAQNQYQKELIKAVNKYDRLLTSEPDNFVKELILKNTTIHAKYHRCKLVSIDPSYGFRDGDRKIVFYANGGTLFSITLKLVSGNYDQAGVQPFITFKKGGVLQ